MTLPSWLGDREAPRSNLIAVAMDGTGMDGWPWHEANVSVRLSRASVIGSAQGASNAFEVMPTVMRR
ncbi:hypothetical protein CC79DRAFT_1328894 [Sarocladium strictum]